MNYTQNRKIEQITDQTLVIGMDIAKKKHFAAMVDARGRELKKRIPVSQSRAGFEQFFALIQEAMRKFGKTEVIVGIEPTGHYWLNLAYFLKEKGIPLVMVNPMHVKRSKELDDNLPTKHDVKDALVIARLVKDGRFSYPRILQDVVAELRAGCTYRESLLKERNVIHNQMIRWLDRYFPEFVQVFPSFGKNALAVLENTPFPMDIADQTVEDLIERYRQSGVLKCPQKPKVQKLIEISRHSIGITEGQQMARIEITSLVRRYRQLEQEIAALTEELTALAQTAEDYQWLQTISGLGDATIVELLSEIGSFHQYQDPRQLIKLAGLTLKENSSGQHKGQKRISKRGRRRLRTLLFRVIIPLISHNKAFRALHEYYTTRPVNPLRKKQSIVVLCGKLLKVLYAICVKQQAFDEERMMQDFFSSTQAQAA